MTIELPDVTIAGQPLTSQQARLELACGLYAAWQVSSGKGARIAGVSRMDFWKELAKRKIPRQYGPEDLEHDLRVIEELAEKFPAADRKAAA